MIFVDRANHKYIKKYQTPGGSWRYIYEEHTGTAKHAWQTVKESISTPSAQNNPKTSEETKEQWEKRKERKKQQHKEKGESFVSKLFDTVKADAAERKAQKQEVTKQKANEKKQEWKDAASSIKSKKDDGTLKKTKLKDLRK